MDANKYIFVQNGLKDFQINIPIAQDWDFEGLDDAIDDYEKRAVSEVIGVGYDFETQRFPHAPYGNDETQINYEFYFYSGGSLDDSSSWRINYLGEGFTTQDIFYFANSFSKSFFKLDFYDTVDDKKQKNLFTVIIPTQQGETMPIYMATTLVNIKRPKFNLNYIGDKEGFFLYWLKSLKFLPINTFYMTAKFWNAETGRFTTMITKPQSTIVGNKYAFDSIEYFYYRVVLNYEALNYQVFTINTNNRVGTTTPIKWYEYVNPPA